jgi:hypothetical protein
VFDLEAQEGEHDITSRQDEGGEAGTEMAGRLKAGEQADDQTKGKGDRMIDRVWQTSQMNAGCEGFNKVPVKANLGHGLVIEWSSPKILQQGIHRTNQHDGIAKLREKRLAKRLLFG